MDALDLLLNRASAVRLEGPAPSGDDLDIMLRSALRAPDHGRLRPWRFVIIPEDQRDRFGACMGDLLLRRMPDATAAMVERERQKAKRAPLIIVVAARPKPSDKVPQQEQVLSAGAAAQNIMLSAHALGYGAMWKTGAPAYDPQVKEALGLDRGDTVVAFIYVGTSTQLAATSSPRPDPSEFVAIWGSTT